MKSAVIFLCIVFVGNNSSCHLIYPKQPEPNQQAPTDTIDNKNPECILNSKYFQEDPDLKRCKGDRIDFLDKVLCDVFTDLEKRLCRLINDKTQKEVESMLNSTLKDPKYQTKANLCFELKSLYVNEQHNVTFEKSCMKMCDGANSKVDKLCIYINSLNKVVQKRDVLDTSAVGNDSPKSVPAAGASNHSTLTEKLIEVSKKPTVKQSKLVENNGPPVENSMPAAQKEPAVNVAATDKTKVPIVATVEKVEKMAVVEKEEKVATVEKVEEKTAVEKEPEVENEAVVEKEAAVEKEAVVPPLPSRLVTEQPKAPGATSTRQPDSEYDEDPGDDQESFPPTERGGSGGAASALPADRLGPDALLEPDESNFFSYFMLVSVLCIIGYVLYHNKQKVFALLLEGRKERGARRRPNTAGYRKLNSNLEEAVTSKCSGSAAHVIY